MKNKNFIEQCKLLHTSAITRPKIVKLTLLGSASVTGLKLMNKEKT
jgi:hypothetical protein